MKKLRTKTASKAARIKSDMALKIPKESSFSPAAFKAAMTGAKKLFAAKGIKSKADAYQLINQGFAEKRFTEADVRALQHATSLVFDDNSFGLAQMLLNAKDKGLKLADAKRKANADSPKPGPDINTIRAKNRSEFGGGNPPPEVRQVPQQEQAPPEAPPQPQQAPPTPQEQAPPPQQQVPTEAQQQQAPPSGGM
jgi:hypothetical protein